MAFWNRKNRSALGLHIDGEQVRIAHLRRDGDRIALVGLGSTTLKRRLDIEENQEADAPEPEDDILGLETPAEDESEDEGGAATNMEVIYQLLETFPVKESTVAFSLIETGVFFSDYADDFGLEGKKLKQRLLEEAGKDWGENAPEATPLADRHDYFRAGPRLVSVVHEDSLEMLGLLDQLQPFIGDVRVGLIEPVELTLMNLVRRCHALAAGVTAIVYIGEDYSRAVFMQDGEYLALSQPIYEGAKSDAIVQTICSRLRYERDMADLPEIDRIVLAGHCRSAEAQALVVEQFPGVDIDVLGLDGLEIDCPDDEGVELLPNFAVAIGLAWKTLQPKEPRFYPLNFLPEARRRQQNILELSWHGVALLALVLAVGLYAGVEARDNSRQLDFGRLENELMTVQIAEGERMVRRIDTLHAEITRYEAYFTLIDSLESRRTYMSDQIKKAAVAVHQTNSLWLERLSTEENGTSVSNLAVDRYLDPPQRLYLSGKSLYRNRVPRLARRFEEEHVRSMVRDRIREITVYKFDITAPVLAVEPPGEAPR